MKLFVDTTAWVAYYDASDQWHGLATAAMASLIRQPVTLVTTDYILDETITLLLYHAGRQHAVAFGEQIQLSRHVRIVTIEPEIWQRSWQFFKQYDDKNWAFTDCTSFVVMRQLGLSQAFTFDHHFAQAGFQIWPKES